MERSTRSPLPTPWPPLKNDALPRDTRRESEARLASESRLAGAADAVLASSPAEARAISEISGGGQVHVVPCGVDLKLFKPHPKNEARARLGLKPDPAYILSVGPYRAREGARSLDRGPSPSSPGERPELDARLLHLGGEIREGAAITGESYRAADFASPAQGAEVARLEELSHKLGVTDAVIFAGAKPQEALPLYYSAADVFALPSRYESFGMTAVEAARVRTADARLRRGRPLPGGE